MPNPLREVRERCEITVTAYVPLSPTPERPGPTLAPLVDDFEYLRTTGTVPC